MFEKQITNQTGSYTSITPPSRLFPDSTFSQFAEESNDSDLRSFFALLRRRAIIIIGIVSIGMTGVAYTTFRQKLIYQGNFQILVEPVNESNDLLAKLTDSTGSSRQNGLDYESQIQVLRSPEIMKPVIEKLEKSYPDITYASLMQDLGIRRFGQAKIIQVIYSSDDPQKIKLILDTISQFYLKYSLEKRQTKLRQGVKFVDKQLPDIQNRVIKLQKEMQIFRQRYNFFDPTSQSSVITSQIQSLTEKRLNLNQQLATGRANYLSLQRREEQLAIFNGSPLYQQLISQQRQLDTQISGELARLQPDNPIIGTLKQKRDNLLPIIEAEAKRTLSIKIDEATITLQNTEVANQQQIKEEQQLQRKLRQLPLLSRQYTDIERNLQLANESLNRFLANREQLQVEVAQTELPWELIQAATQPQYPVSPDIPRNLLLGFVASFLLGMGAALIREKMDNTYHTIENLQNKMKLPILGTLPFDKTLISKVSSNRKNIDKEKVLTEIPEAINKLSNSFRHQSSQGSYYYGQGSFWESLQVLHNNIQLLNTERPIKSLIISSSTPGDGKSTIAFNLAITATTMGKRVLLVDCDLRRSQVHKLLEINNLWGLSSFISSDIDMEQVIQKVPDFENLSVITAGSVPPDPCRLLSSDKMRQLMEIAYQNFDLVIYDVPPILGLVDARLIAPYVDGMMLVVRMNKTDKLSLAQVQDSLKLYPINMLGIIVNADKSASSSYYNSSYYN